MSPNASLLEIVQGLLERTFRMHTGVEEIGRFVIGDVGYRCLYRERPVVDSAPAAEGVGEGAKTLVRETDEGVRACIYYPDSLIECLERHPPQRGITDRNVDAFATLVEEADHLLCIAERARQGRPMTLFELELHANVSKYLVLLRFLGGARARSLGTPRRTWLCYHLFYKGVPSDEDPEVRARYRDATRWALRLIDGLSKFSATRRVEALRRFHGAGTRGKIELIRQLAS